MHSKSALVHQPMMAAAQQNQIAELGLAAVSPVMDMMRIDKSGMSASGKPAALIPSNERPAQWTGHRSGFSACIYGFTVCIDGMTD